MNVHGLCAFGAVNEAKVDRLIKEAEREGVVLVAIQEHWFKKKRYNEQLVRMLADKPWSWYGDVRRRQKRKDKKGSGGTGVFMHDSVGKVCRRPTNVNGVIWLEIEAGGETTHVLDLYLVPTGSPRIHHNETAMREFERVMACTAGERRIVMGDWNARIGECPSLVFTGKEEERGNIVVLEEKEYTRTSADKKGNAAGRDILDVMNAQGLVVMNGYREKIQCTQRGNRLVRGGLHRCVAMHGV